MPDIEPLFSPDGGRLVPSGHTRGPWDPRHQHGGPVAALVARAAEAEIGAGFTVTRLTIELQRPVPLAPLVVAAQVTKPGRRVVRAEVTVTAAPADPGAPGGSSGAGGSAAPAATGDAGGAGHDAGAGEVVVRATAVAVRHADVPLGADAPDDGRGAVPEPGPEAGVPLALGGPPPGPAFHTTGMDVRIVGGEPGRPGPARVWFRLARPVVAGEQPSGLQRAAAAADFCNGVSWVLPFERWTFVNPDLTLHLARPAEGEWICLDARTVVSDAGTALAEAELYDREGRLGRAAQSLILEPRMTT